ncbi:Hypothetical predicted protein [Cloeon dipterum]|uniref:Uncharacterized protein n=1 Tax=Cloeon dipterum TaxID=197152 RepID=A0A8S1CYS3_9INSE|nr:Hypothetical predicted protein [Cloeon dipterum]
MYKSTRAEDWPIVKYDNIQKNGCPKCNLPLKNLQTYKVLAGLSTPTVHLVCGKRIEFGHTVVATDFDMPSLFCGIIWPNTKHWLPKDYDEVRCIIESLPPDIQKLGRLRVQVYKSNCSEEFFFCSVDTPRSLRNSFLSPELNKTKTAFPDASCAFFEYNIRQKKAVDVRLNVTSCKEKAFSLCEGMN